MDQFKYDNVMEVPKLEKVTINMGLGEAKENAKIMESAVEEIGLITGQRPIVTKARKSIANFKVRQGMPVGAKVTLRGDNMYDFIDKVSDFEMPEKINVLSPDGQDQVVDNYRNYIQQVVDGQITAEEAAQKTYDDAAALFTK